jgi:hypothetical protein
VINSQDSYSGRHDITLRSMTKTLGDLELNRQSTAPPSRGELKFTLEQAMKAQRGSGGIALRFL